jgi:hypothetical protein
MFHTLVVRNTRDNEGNTSQTPALETAADVNAGQQIAETYYMKAAEQNSKPKNNYVKHMPGNAEQTTNILAKMIN